MMKLLALLATAAALKQPLQKPLAVRGGGIETRAHGEKLDELLRCHHQR